MISLVYSSSTPKAPATSALSFFYNRVISVNNPPSALACAVFLALSMGTSGCQMTTTNTMDSAAEIQAHNEHLTTIYSDLSSALGTYFPLGYTQFAVLDPHNTDSTNTTDNSSENTISASVNTSDDSATDSATDNTAAITILQPEQALARALIQQGANVCQAPQSCDLKAQKLTTTITTGPDYVLVELVTPDFTLQRLYDEQAQALGPLSLYGNNNPQRAMSANSTAANTAAALLSAHDATTNGSATSTAARATNTANTRRTSSPAKKALLARRSSKTLTAPTPVARNATANSRKNATATTAATAANTATPQQGTGSTTHDLDVTLASQDTATKDAITARDSSQNRDSSAAAIAAPNAITTQPENTSDPASVHAPATAPAKAKKPLHLGPLQTAQNDHRNAEQAAATSTAPAPDTKATTTSAATTGNTAAATTASTTASASGTATHKNNSGNTLATISAEEQANILTNRYQLAQRTSTPIFYSNAQPIRYSHSHRNSAAVLQLGMS